MSIKEITVGFSRTINLGGYESARVEASVTAQIPDAESYERMVETAQRELKYLLEQTWTAQRETIKGRKEIA